MSEVSFTPTGDKLVIKVLDQQTTEGGLFLPENSLACDIAVVLAVGPGRVEHGELIPVEVIIGQKVVYMKKFAAEFIIMGKKYTMIEEKNLIATY